MTIKYLLRDPNAKKATPVNIRIAWKNNSVVFGSGVKVHPSNFKEDNVKNKDSRIKNSDADNETLNKKRKYYIVTFKGYESVNGFEPLSKQDFKDFILSEQIRKTEEIRLEKLRLEKEVASKVTFYEALNKKVEAEKKRLIAEGNYHKSGNVSKQYERLGVLLANFTEENGTEVSYESITMDWYYSFNDFMNDKDFSPNYKGKLIKNIIAILNLGLLEGYSTNAVHKKKEFKKEAEATHKVYLNESEISRLFNFDLNYNNEYSIARDWLVFGCETSLRISDQKRINKDCIITNLVDTYDKGVRTDIERKFIRIVTTKTKTEVDIPLSEKALEILEKHDYDLPKLYDQKYNRLVKEVCHEVGIDNIEKFTRKAGNKIEKLEVPKYELVSSHTGRRSYSTNQTKRGTPMLTTMAITGHSKVEDFENYIILDANEHAKIIARNDYKVEQEKRAANHHLKLA
jgi:integrase